MLKKGLAKFWKSSKPEIQVIRNASLVTPDAYWDFSTFTSPIAISVHATRGLIAILCIRERVKIFTVEGYFVTTVKLRNRRIRGLSFRESIGPFHSLTCC